MKINCPECGKALICKEEHIGKSATCRDCKTRFPVKASQTKKRPKMEKATSRGKKLKTPSAEGVREGRAGKSSPGRRQRQPKKRPAHTKMKSLAGGAAAVVALVVVAALVFRGAEAANEDLLPSAMKRLRQDYAQAEDCALACQLAGYHHHTAVFKATGKDLRGRQRVAVAVDEETYYGFLKTLVADELSRIKSEPTAEPTEKALEGYWSNYDYSRNATVYLKIAASGSYVLLAFEGKDLEGFNKGEPAMGTVAAQPGQLTWDGSDTNPILYFTAVDIILKETDGTVSHWRRINSNKTQQSFDRIHLASK